VIIARAELRDRQTLRTGELQDRRHSLSAMFGGVPPTDVLILLAGLPLAAAAGHWPTGSRESSRDSHWNETGLTGHFSTAKVER
jgi:hypothetical protein